MPDAMHIASHRAFLRYAIQEAPEGAVLEFGVYSGTTINWMAEDFTSKQFHGFDSFEGLPGRWTGHELFDFDLHGKPPHVPPNVELIEGLFDDTLPDFSKSFAGEIAAIHVDCDLYSSTKAVFDTIGSRLKDGCIIIFDEYFNYPGFEMHERKAFSEFLTMNLIAVDWLAFSGQRTVGRLKRADQPI